MDGSSCSRAGETDRDYAQGLPLLGAPKVLAVGYATWQPSRWLQWLHLAFARVRSLEWNSLQTVGFGEQKRTGANARQSLPCRRSWVRVPSSALKTAAQR